MNIHCFIYSMFDLFHMGVLCMCPTLKRIVEQFIVVLCMQYE